MSLERIQKCIAILSSDPELALRFARQECAAEDLIGFPLTEQEQLFLEEFNRKHVAQFADSLVAKRVQELEKIFPVTATFPEGSFPGRYRKFLQNSNGANASKDHAQALQFGEFLMREFKSEKNYLAANLIAFESTWLAARNAGRCFVIKCLRLPSKAKDAAPNARWRLCLWIRWTPKAKLAYWQFP